MIPRLGGFVKSSVENQRTVVAACPGQRIVGAGGGSRERRGALTLVGDLALRQIPVIVAAVQQGAEQGMGCTRLRSRVG